MRRIQGWEKRLAEYLLARKNMPFEWGANDCVSFAIGAIEVVTGEIVWEVDWTDARSAMKIIEDEGGMVAGCSAAMGRSGGQNWRAARRGDIALIDLDGRQSAAICTGQTLCGPGVERLEHVPLKEALHIWPVG